MVNAFKEDYKKLNTAQKEAVDTIDGPVMVVAGPGTGKTQILALRIGNVLTKTDTKADGILCLTFTNSAVEAMKNRLINYIGETGEKVNIFTFHSFGMKVIEEHYKVLGLSSAPKLLEDTDAALLFYEILNWGEWEYLRPRGDHMRYFSDLRSIISLLKRERITKEDFTTAIKKEIKFIERDEKNISTRGESKGELKKEAQKQIEGLNRSYEIIKFIELYEEAKKEKNVLDYDDVLESLVAIMEISEDAVASMRERYLYVLIDEHQDSSRVQNEFLKKVWSEVEGPNIFVVGDDRQLIYGFSGASIDHFQGFKKTFKDAKLIPLVDNYRSTQVILDASHALLQSVMSNEKLISQNKEHHPIRLIEVDTPENEIIAAGMEIKNKISKGLNLDDCAILVPKNRQVRKALEILHDLGLPIASLEALNLFDQEEAMAFLRVLKIITTGDTPSLALSFFDKISGVEPIQAHQFLAGKKMKEFSFGAIKSNLPTLFGASNQVEEWTHKLVKWEKYSKENDLKSTIEMIGEDLLKNEIQNNKMVGGCEIVDTILNLLTKELEKNSSITLVEFVSFLEQLKSYVGDIPLVSAPKEGIKVLTMHSSKGLEFDYVWIAHMDERSLGSGKRMGFTLPETIRARMEERDIDAVKRKLYVAITRAKKFCTLSYSIESQKGSEQELARIIGELPPRIFVKESMSQKTKTVNKEEKKNNNLSKLQKLVSKKYITRFVSASLLNNFFECPWRWYFRNLLQLPEPTTKSLEFGNMVHEAIDKILKLKNSPTTKQLEEITFSNKEVLKIVSRWVDARLKQISLDRQNEQSVSMTDDKFPHLNIYGKIDLIEKLNKEQVRVTDFKTGSVRKKSDIEKIDKEGRLSGYHRQLTMYSYLLTKSPKWNTEVSESRLEFVEAKKEAEYFYNTVITNEQIELIRKDIADYDKLVKAGEWVNRPCNFNSYGKNTECEYCKIAKVYL